MTEAARDLLEKYFDTAFNAPDGIAKLRELILTLAMQGKLVEQDAHDPCVAELLNEIEAEKRRLIKQGEISKSKPTFPVNQDEIPYQLPKSWTWVRVRDVCHDWGQKEPADSFTYIDVGAINNKLGVVTPDPAILSAAEAPSRARKIVKPKTVIYSTVRPYLLNIAIIEKEYDPEPIASTAFAILHPYAHISERYIFYYLRSPVFVRYVEKAQKGVAYPAINDGDLFTGVFPLPPLPEQKRIVTKIDQLMARCDALEKLRAEREQQRIEVHAAAIRQLLAEPEGTAWPFLQKRFGELYTTKENVAELRKAILQLAVMGKLVPQDPNDQPASELLKEIEAEKHRLIKDKRIKKSKPTPIVSSLDEPFIVPDTWQWVRISDIAETIDYGTSQKTCDDSRLVPVYRMGNIVSGQLIDHGFKYISPDIDELPYLYLQPNDLLFNRTNSYELVGKSALFTGPAEHATFASYLIRLRLLNGYVLPEFICNVMNSPYFRDTQIEPEIVQQCGQANFNGTKLSLCLIPLPPVLEQQRIVVRIKCFMELCDALNQKIENTNGKKSELLDTLMAYV